MARENPARKNGMGQNLNPRRPQILYMFTKEYLYEYLEVAGYSTQSCHTRTIPPLYSCANIMVGAVGERVKHSETGGSCNAIGKGDGCFVNLELAHLVWCSMMDCLKNTQQHASQTLDI